MELVNYGSGSTGNCYIVHLKNGLYAMLDCGVNLNRVKFNLNNLAFAFISHEHKDHSLNLENLKIRGVPVLEGNLAQEYTKNALKLKNGAEFDTKCDLFTFPVKHGECKCGGLVIKTEKEKILYITDFTAAKIPGFEYTNIIIECNYNYELMQSLLRENVLSYDKDGKPIYSVKGRKFLRQINTHMSDVGLINFLKNLNLEKCERIYLVHNSEGCGEPIISATRIKKATNCNVGVCRRTGGIDYYG